MQANLFATPTATATKTAKKTDKTTIPVPSLEGTMSEYLELRKQIDFLEAKLADAEHEIKSEGRKQFISLYRTNRSNPNSFYLQAGENRVMIMPTDKYKKLEADRYAHLKEKYSDVVEERPVFKFNTELVEKYGEVLSALILGCDGIDESDKGKLIIAEVSYGVKKGAIDRLMESENLSEMLDDIEPIFSLKRS